MSNDSVKWVQWIEGVQDSHPVDSKEVAVYDCNTGEIGIGRYYFQHHLFHATIKNVTHWHYLAQLPYNEDKTPPWEIISAPEAKVLKSTERLVTFPDGGSLRASLITQTRVVDNENLMVFYRGYSGGNGSFCIDTCGGDVVDVSKNLVKQINDILNGD